MGVRGKLLVLATSVSVLAYIPVPSSQAASLLSCLMITNPKATVTGQQVSVTADVYQTCKTYSPGSGSLAVSGFSPNYSINLLGVTCSGPMLKSELLSLPLLGYVLGNVRCSGITTSYGRSSSVITASTADGIVAVSFSHSFIATPVVPKPIQTTPAQTTPAPAPTQTQYVEPPEVTQALKEINNATEVVNTEVSIADEALAEAVAAGERVESLLQLIDQLLAEMRERINSWIEMLQRKRPDA